MSRTATIHLTRRECCAGLASLLGALATGACATVSPQQERELGRKEAQEVERTVGLVRDRRLVEYVEAIGKRLAQAAGRPDVAWQWAVADDAEANAFALPSGRVYVTRGLLALSNREEEVAGVMGHEMAHVIERHAVSRVGAATPIAVLFGVPSGLLGMVSPGLGEIVGGAGRVLAGLTLAPYSREQEHEADRTGIALCARAGWDPGALATFLGTLERAESVAGRASTGSSFFSTHPSTPDRVKDIATLSRSLTHTPVPAIAGDRATFLGRLDGLVVGNSAATGVFVGRQFLHPDFDLALEMPAGWKTANSPRAAGAVAPGDDAVVFLQLVGSGDDPVAGAKADGLSDAQIQRLRRISISQLPAATLTANTRDNVRVALTWIAHRKRIFRVTGACRTAEWERYQAELERTAATFRPLRADDLGRITENRLRMRPARAGERIAQVLERGGAAWTPAMAAVSNGVTVDRPLDANWPVKVAVAERYRPAGGGAPGAR